MPGICGRARVDQRPQRLIAAGPAHEIAASQALRAASMDEHGNAALGGHRMEEIDEG